MDSQKWYLSVMIPIFPDAQGPRSLSEAVALEEDQSQGLGWQSLGEGLTQSGSGVSTQQLECGDKRYLKSSLSPAWCRKYWIISWILALAFAHALSNMWVLSERRFWEQALRQYLGEVLQEAHIQAGREEGGEGHLDKVREWEIYCFMGNCLIPVETQEGAVQSMPQHIPPHTGGESGSNIHWHLCGQGLLPKGCQTWPFYCCSVSCLLPPAGENEPKATGWRQQGVCESCGVYHRHVRQCLKALVFSLWESGDYRQLLFQSLVKRKVHVKGALGTVPSK